jgi:hypothetical protein
VPLLFDNRRIPPGSALPKVRWRLDHYQPKKHHMKNQQSENPSNARPVHRIRNGAVTASIWRQDTDKGPLFNVTFQRTYKDKDKWRYSGSFGRKDLLVVGLIAAKAFDWIATQSQKASKRQPASP